jgi:GntR family transcriptional regulator/MocR family aminotransferase
MNRSTSTDLDGSTRGLLLELSLHDVARPARSAALAEQLRGLVRRGALPAETRLPASRSLAADLGVSRGVVVRAYEQLVAEGYLRSRHGSGTRVARASDRPAPSAPSPDRPPGNPGLPSGAAFPRTAWARAAAQAIRDLHDADLGYGDPAGTPALRRELSSYLGRVRAVQAPPERLLIVNGFAQTTRLLADVLVARGTPRVAVEDPGSIGMRLQLERCGVRCLPLPVDGDGLRVDLLDGTDAAAVVVTPAHQFPTGVVLAPERRHALLGWARRTGGLVVEDDYDAEFRYDRSPVGALQGLGPDVVLHGGSVSKTLAPALRLGWIAAPEHLVAPFAAAKYDLDLATGVFDQATFATFLATGEMDRHVRRMAVRYRRRRDRLVTALEEALPAWEVSGAAAGLHLLLRPPVDDDEHELAALFQRCGLDARPLGHYAVRPPTHPGLVVGYAHRSAEVLEAAVRRVASELAT